MPDTRISDLTVLTAPAAGDLIPIVDISDTTMAASGTTKRVTQADLSASFLASAQPLDATLTALAAVTTAADKVIYATGVDTFATTDLTSVSRTLLAQTTQALMRTTGLGLGTIATQAASSVAITGGTINGATVGATTPATGAFTSLSATTGANLATISGRVGIGTTSPAVSLDIPAYSTGNSQLQVGSLQYQSYSVCNSFLFDNIYYNGGYKYRYSGFGVGWQSSYTASGDYAILNFASGTAGDSATPNARLYIASGGNVGIGTTAPNYACDVFSTSAGAETIPLGLRNNSSTNGTATSLGFSSFNGNTITGKITSLRTSSGTYALTLSNWTGLSAVEVVRIDGSGNVGIGTSSPNANAILDVSSTTKAFMPPRMTTTQKNAIASPTAGMVVYDSTLHKLCVRAASAWETVTSV